MRIPLVGEQAQKQKRAKPARRGSRTLDSAITIPATPASRERRHGAARSRRVHAGRTSQHGVAARPRRPVSWRALAGRLPVLLLTLVAFGGMVYASSDAQFFVYEGHIIGASYLHPAIIYQAAGVHEQSIFWVHPGRVAARVAQVEGVKSVQVKCELPARVLITVEERQPRILWRVVSQERDWWVDGEGIVLPYHGDPDSPDVIFVVDYSERNLTIGDRIKPGKLVESVLLLAEAMPQVRLYTYHADRGLGFTQELDGGQWPVYVGSSEDLERKVQVMHAMTSYLASNNIRPRYVDVRWADHPVFGRAEGALRTEPGEETAGGGE